MSRSNGTGQPIVFKCRRCRSLAFTTTGVKRPAKRYGRGGSLRVDRDYEYGYRCAACGYIGLSRHIDVKQSYEKAAAAIAPLVKEKGREV